VCSSCLAEKLATLIVQHERDSGKHTIRPIEILKMCSHDFKEYYKVKWTKLSDKYNDYNYRDLSVESESDVRF
jgi:hypothetical protein